MNAILMIGAMLALAAPDVQTSPQSATQLYVKTVPPGATVTLDGKAMGKSNALFDSVAGSHRLLLQLKGYIPAESLVEVRQGEITRVEIELKKRSDIPVVLSYVGDTSDGMRSFADSGHAVAFQRPVGMKSIVAVKLFAARYGYDEPPNEDFHIYLLDENQKVLEQVAVPYRKIEKGDLRWYTLDFPAIEVPEKFFVAVWFNAESTKGVYLGMDKKVQAIHSFIGLPDKGFQKVDQSYDWMIRAVVSSQSGKKPTHPKVTTYEEEKAADTENAEASPMRPGTIRPAPSVWTPNSPALRMARSCSRKPMARPLAFPWIGFPRRIGTSWPSRAAPSSGQPRPTPRTIARQRQDGRQIEHCRQRPCGEVQGRRRLVVRHLREPARVALRRASATERGLPSLDLRCPVQAHRHVSLPLQFLYSQQSRLEIVPHSTHARAARLHRLLRLQSASDQRGVGELRRPAEQDLDDRHSRQGPAETVYQGQLADPLQGGEASG